MSDIKSVDLRGKIPDAGAVHFLGAEWKVPQSRFVIVRFALDNKSGRCQPHRYGPPCDRLTCQGSKDARHQIS
jgi:hypothetical protein